MWTGLKWPTAQSQDSGLFRNYLYNSKFDHSSSNTTDLDWSDEDNGLTPEMYCDLSSSLIVFVIGGMITWLFIDFGFECFRERFLTDFV